MAWRLQSQSYGSLTWCPWWQTMQRAINMIIQGALRLGHGRDPQASQQTQRQVVQRRHDLGRLALARAHGVFAKRPIAPAMQPAFDAPMLPRRL
jgi:hypothetical protein